MKAPRDQRISVSFHETFRLERSRLAELLKLAKNNGGFTRDDLEKANTSLGNNMRRSFPRWGIGTGLLYVDRNRYVLSAFGQAVLEHDPALRRLDTQWIIHYHLSAPDGPGPAFWHHLFAEIIRPGRSFTRGDIEHAIKAVYGARIGDKLAQTTATVFLGTYTNTDGLGHLHLIRPVKQEPDRYELSLDAEPPSQWAFAYALVDHWDRSWSEHVTVRFDWLFQPRSLTSLLFLGQSQAEKYLGELQREGWIEIFRVAPPFQLVRRWADAEEKKQAALQRLYAHDAA